jgi:TonB family protein
MVEGGGMICTRRTLTVVVLASLLSASSAITASGPSQGAAAEEPLKQLVVMIQTVTDDQKANGAGFIFGRQGNRLYVVTANHVVRMGPQQAQQVKVQFKWAPGEWFDGRVLEHEDRDLDLAVLSVVTQDLEVPELAWKSWTSPEKLKPGDYVRPIGFPRGVPWFTPQQRHVFNSTTPLYVRSEGELDPGNSGGALVTEDWGIVGVVSQADRPYNRATRIDRALEKLAEWGYPVHLTEKPWTPPSTTNGQPPSTSESPRLTYEGPRVAKEVQPLYPAGAKASRIEGTVELTCIVSVEGRATEVKVIKSLEPRLDEAAIEALLQWEFTPAMKFGEPVPARMSVEMTFGLK